MIIIKFEKLSLRCTIAICINSWHAYLLDTRKEKNKSRIALSSQLYKFWPKPKKTNMTRSVKKHLLGKCHSQSIRLSPLIVKGSDYISVQQRWCPIPLHDSKADVLMGRTQPQEGGAQPQSSESPV